MARLKKFWKYFLLFVLVFFVVDFGVFYLIDLPKEYEKEEFIQTNDNIYERTKFIITKYIAKF